MLTLNQLVAENVRQLREQRGWSQRDLADRLDATWTRSAVAALENQGVRARDVVDLTALCIAFGVDVEKLLAGEGEVELPGGESVPLPSLRDALFGRLPARSEPVVPVLRWSRDDPEEMARVARRLDLSAAELEFASAFVFQTPRFLIERDRRAGITDETPRRTAQARRGHATRTMLGELTAAFATHGREEVLQRGALLPPEKDLHGDAFLGQLRRMGLDVDDKGQVSG